VKRYALMARSVWRRSNDPKIANKKRSPGGTFTCWGGVLAVAEMVVILPKPVPAAMFALQVVMGNDAVVVAIQAPCHLGKWRRDLAAR